MFQVLSMPMRVFPLVKMELYLSVGKAWTIIYEGAKHRSILESILRTFIPIDKE